MDKGNCESDQKRPSTKHQVTPPPPPSASNTIYHHPGADPENVQGRGYYKPEAPHLSRLLEAPTCPAIWRPLKSNLSDVRYYMLTLAGRGWGGGGGDATLPLRFFYIFFVYRSNITIFFYSFPPIFFTSALKIARP